MKGLRRFLILMLWSFHSAADFDTNMISPMSLDQATREVMKDSNNRVLGAFTEWVEGREVHVIKVVTQDGRIIHYRIDAMTGARIS